MWRFQCRIGEISHEARIRPTEIARSGIVNFESFLNHFAPFDSAFGIYLLALFLALGGLLLWAFEWSARLQKAHLD